MIFADRKTAGELLAKKLDAYFSQTWGELNRSRLLVIGLPRGGLPVALEVARKFKCPLDFIVAKKLPYPGMPEYAIGAVSSDGVTVITPNLQHQSQWKEYITTQREHLLQQTKEKEKYFKNASGHHSESLQGKVVIIVDDGIATGMTVAAAIESARHRGAQCTIVATPVISHESYQLLGAQADAVVALSVPREFCAVGKHYLNFTQTTDQQVIEALKEAEKFVPLPHLRSEFESISN